MNIFEAMNKDLVNYAIPVTVSDTGWVGYFPNQAAAEKFAERARRIKKCAVTVGSLERVPESSVPPCLKNRVPS